MSVIFVVLPLAMLIVAAAVIAFVWAVRRGQFDDLDTPAVRILHDDAETAPRTVDPADRNGAEYPLSPESEARIKARPDAPEAPEASS